MLKKILPYFLLVVCLGPLVWPLVQPGFFQTDDGNWMVIRLAAFHQTLRAGQFPVRFLLPLNHGYGYPVLDFLYPLPFYLGELVHLVGPGFVDSVKILFGASFILGAFFMYRYAGFSAAIIYSYLPYRITDVYTRGSLGESVVFIFAPLVFWLLEKRRIVLAALAMAALISSHNTLALLFLPIALVLSRSWRFLTWSLLLSAWFWLPALYDLQFTRAAAVQVANYSQYFVSYLDPLVLIGLAACLFGRRQKLLVVVTLISLFFTLPISNFFWQHLPLPRLVQFPWRFFAVTVFTTALLLKNIPKYWLLVVAVVGLLALKIDRTFYPESFYATNDATTTVKNEYMPKWVLVDPQSRPTVPSAVYFPGLKVVEKGHESEPILGPNGIVETTGKFVFRETPVRFFADLLSLASIIYLVFGLWRKKFL